VWTFYGVLRSDYTVLVPNLFGLSIYLSIYQYIFIAIYASVYLSNHNIIDSNPLGVFSGVYCVICFHLFVVKPPLLYYGLSIFLILVSSYLAYVGDWQLIGSIGCILAVLLTASPLAVVKTVVVERSTASLPFGTTCMMFCNSVSWSTYGLLVANDVMV
jgi:hypothetical protein